MKTLTTLLVLVCCVPILMGQKIKVPDDQPSIQAGINAASDGDTVLVAEGEYLENIRFNGKAITLASHFILEGDTTHISRTIINGSQPAISDSASVVIFGDGEDSTSVLCGFTITGGTGTLYLDPIYGIKRIGGGVLTLPNSGGTIEHNDIRHNTMEYPYQTWGGGICVLLGPLGDENFVNSVIIHDNTIRYNSILSSYVLSASSGGGIKVGVGNELKNGRILIENNIITRNEVRNTAASGGKSAGGGILFGMLLPTPPGEYIIRNNIVSHNKATGSGTCWGGGMYFDHINVKEEYYFDSVPAPHVYNNIIHHNEASTFGGGIAYNLVLNTVYNGFITVPQPVIVNNTLYENYSHWAVGMFRGSGPPLLFNNILWDDTTATDTTTEIGFFGDYHLAYNNCVKGDFGPDSLNNFDQNPAFLSLEEFTLDWNSPCADTGLDSIRIQHPDFDIIDLWYYAPRYDFNDSVRPAPAGSKPDLGAIESIYPNAIHEITKNMNSLTIYPNPVSDQLMVRTTGRTSIFKIEIIDISGRLVRSISGIRSMEASIPRGSLKEGIYFVRVYADQIYSGKIIVK